MQKNSTEQENRVLSPAFLWRTFAVKAQKCIQGKAVDSKLYPPFAVNIYLNNPLPGRNHFKGTERLQTILY